MSILITGGTGFLGSYLARHLVLEKGIKDLVLFERYPNLDRIDEVKGQVTLVQGDVLEPQELLAAMKKYQVDRVFHFAAILGDPPPTQVVAYLKVMCNGTANVFEAARIHGVKRVVYASPVEVYGASTHRQEMASAPEVDEDDPPTPNSFYGVCKLWKENIAAIYTQRFGLETVALRPTSVFGLGRGFRGSYASGLAKIPEAPHFMVLPELAALGQPVEMPPDSLEADWIYAADAAEAWWCAMTTEKPPHLVYNMSAERRRMGDVTAQLRKLLPDGQITVSKEPVRVGQYINAARLRKELGFKPKYNMETGMTHYLNLVRKRVGLPPVKG